MQRMTAFELDAKLFNTWVSFERGFWRCKSRWFMHVAKRRVFESASSGLYAQEAALARFRGRPYLSSHAVFEKENLMPKPPFVRPRITKFFEADMLENYQVGSFWFGTLKRYRMIEKKEADVVVEPRFSDRREGIVEHAHKFETGHAKSAKIGGITFTNCHFGGNGADIMLTHEFNDFVFCASWGAYSHQQHLDIKNGAMSVAETQYEGNSKLTHFAEIDLIDFLDAVALEAPRTPLWNTTLPESEYLLHSRVKYGQTEKSISIPSVYESSGIAVTTEDYLRTMFTKPTHFSPENEFRVVLRANAPNSLEGDPAGMKLMHRKLRRSIRKIGILDGEV